MSVKKGSLKMASYRKNSQAIFNDYWDELSVKMEVPTIHLSRLIDEIFRTIRDYNDDRAFVLVGAMLVENTLDIYLSDFIQGYGKFRDLREITFSTKIELAKSLYFSPIDKINALDIIRKIRNKFAHYIPITSLEEIDATQKQSLLDNLRKFQLPDSETLDSKSTKELFENLVSNVCRMLLWYGYHIELLNEYIRSDEIYDALEDFYNRKKSSLLDTQKNEEPESH